MPSTGHLARLLTRTLVLVLLACRGAAALAAPEDDYKAGVKAFSGGDAVAAMTMFRKAADAGHAPAQARLGDLLDKAEYNDDAVDYFRKAAAQGNADGEYGLGAMYAAGEGVKRDHVEARSWFTRAAQKDHALAINVLAQAYMKGDLGLTDAERAGEPALHWIRRAADNGHVPALEFLARAYRAGRPGLAVDLKEAERLEARVKAIKGTTVVSKSGKAKK